MTHLFRFDDYAGVRRGMLLDDALFDAEHFSLDEGATWLTIPPQDATDDYRYSHGGEIYRAAVDSIWTARREEMP